MIVLLKKKSPVNTTTNPSTLLTLRFRKIIFATIERVFYSNKNSDIQANIDLCFQTINRCFKEHAPIVGAVDQKTSDSSNFGKFLIDFVPDQSLNNFFLSVHLKDLANLRPFITSDNIVL